MRFRTGGGEVAEIWWEIQVTWEKRREIHQSKAIELRLLGRRSMFEIDTDKLLGILWPECIEGWAKGGGQMAKGTEEEFWALPMAHLDGLAVQVGEWLVTGIEPDYDQDSNRGDAENAENDKTGDDRRGPLGIV